MAKVLEPPKVGIPSQEILHGIEKNAGLNGIVGESLRKHLYWTEIKYKLEANPDLKNINVADIWAVVKLLRRANLKNLRIGGMDLKFAVSDEIERWVYTIHDGLKSVARGNIFNPKTDVGERFIRESLMEEAIASSIMEGANTTRRVAKDMLNENRPPKNKEERMVSNNYRTMEFIRGLCSSNDSKITPELVISIQAMLTEGTLEHPEDVGKLRDTNEIVVGDKMRISKDYQPPDYHAIRAGLKGLCEFANDNRVFIHPIIKACVIHYFVGYLHPFNDGNGRTARALFYWHMIRQGYDLMEIMPISTVIRRSPGLYAESYQRCEFDENDVTYFIRYKLEVLEKALKLTTDYIREKLNEYEALVKRAKLEEQLNYRQVDILQKALNRPSKGITISEVQNLYGVVYQTARADLLKLAELGYLEQRKAGHKFMFTPPKDIKTLISPKSVPRGRNNFSNL